MKMTNKRFWMAMVLVFTFVGCDLGSNNNGSIDGAINGTWSRSVILTSEQSPHWKYCNNCIANLFQGGGLNPCDDCIWIDETTTVNVKWEHELAFNENSSFTMSSNGTHYVKGTYSTNNGKITINPIYHRGLDSSNFEKEWYSKNEMEKAFKLLRSEGMLEGTDEDIDRKINDLFTSSTSGYSVKDNTLTITIEDEKQKFIRKN